MVRGTDTLHLLICSPIQGHLLVSKFGAAPNKVAVNIYVSVYLCMDLSVHCSGIRAQE